MGSFLQNVWNKYKNLDISIIYCREEELTKLEQFYIDNLKNTVTDPPDTVSKENTAEIENHNNVKENTPQTPDKENSEEKQEAVKDE